MSYDPTQAAQDLAALWAEATQTTKGYRNMPQPLVAGTHWYAAQQAYLACKAHLTPDPTPTPAPTPSPSPTPSPTLGTALPPRMHPSTYIAESPGGAHSITVPANGSIAAAVGSAKPGWVIYLRGGQYANNASMVIQNRHFGTIGALSPDGVDAVTIRSYPGEKAIIRGTAGSASNGLYFGNSTGIRVVDVAFNTASSGASLKFDSAYWIETVGCDHYDCVGNGPLFVADAYANYNTNYNVQLWDGEIRNAGTAAPGTWGGPHSVYVGHGNHLVVANHSIHDQQTPMSQIGPSAEHVYWVNNTNVMMQNCLYSFLLSIWTQGTTNDPLGVVTNNAYVANNIFAYAQHQAIQGIGGITDPSSNHAWNNLFWANGSDYVANYPAWFATTPPPGATGGQAGYDADPLFASLGPAGFTATQPRDLHLTAGSPARGKAVPEYCPPADKDGVARDPSAAALGCYA